MKIAIATDHNGVKEKEKVKEYLKELNVSILDLSTDNYDTDDYPDFAKRVCSAINNKNADLGILMCGTGIGMSIAANKVKGIRCAKVSSINEARLSREHNNANIMAVSYKMDFEIIKECVKTFIETEFSNEERHIRRVNKIIEMESNND